MPPTATEADAGTAHCSRSRRAGRGAGLPLTVYVVPGQVLEGLIKQDDGQRYLEHHPPLAPTQWGHLENKLWGRLVKGRAVPAPQATGSSPRPQGLPEDAQDSPEAPPRIPVYPLSLLEVPSQAPPHPLTPHQDQSPWSCGAVGGIPHQGRA